MQAAKAADDSSNKRQTVMLPPLLNPPDAKPAARDTRSPTVQRFFAHVQDVAAAASASSSSTRCISSHRSLPSALTPGSDVGFNDLATILQSISLQPVPAVHLSNTVKERCLALKEGRIKPQEFYDYVDANSIELEDQMRSIFDFINELPNGRELFRQFLEMAGAKADPEVPWRGRVPALRFYIFIMQEGVALQLGKYPFAQATFRVVCDTVNLSYKPNTPPPSPQSPHIHRAKEILFSRLSKLIGSAALVGQVNACLRHIAEIAKARKFVVKGEGHFALTTFLLRVVNPELATVWTMLEKSSDQRLHFIALNMKTLSICLQSDFNKMKDEEVKKDPNFGPMLKAFLG